MGEWRKVDDSTPRGRKLIAGYFNELGNWRTVTARYYEADTLPWSEDQTDEEGGFAPAGWYEESETHETLLPMECPTHWMPLAAPPEKDAP